VAMPLRLKVQLYDTVELSLQYSIDTMTLAGGRDLHEQLFISRTHVHCHARIAERKIQAITRPSPTLEHPLIDDAASRWQTICWLYGAFGLDVGILWQALGMGSGPSAS